MVKILVVVILNIGGEILFISIIQIILKMCQHCISENNSKPTKSLAVHYTIVS